VWSRGLGQQPATHRVAVALKRVDNQRVRQAGSGGWSWNRMREKYCWAGWSWSWWLEWCERKLL